MNRQTALKVAMETLKSVQLSVRQGETLPQTYCGATLAMADEFLVWLEGGAK